MNKKLILIILLLLGCIATGVLVVGLIPKKSSLQSSPIQMKKPNSPSITFKEYIDPSGFSFSYPDDISLEKNETEEPNTYSDIQLFSKDVSGSLSLKVTDSKLTSLDDWLKSNGASMEGSKEVKLGDLKALQYKTADRVYIGALDQGILFAIEIPLLEEGFWTKVSEKVLSDFAFTTPGNSNAQEVDPSLDSVAFEGEEVVE